MYRVYHGTFGVNGARSNDDSSLSMDTKATERSKTLLMNMEAEVKAKAMCPIRSQRRASNVRMESIKGESNEISKLTREQIDRLADKQRELLIDTYKEMEKNPVKNGLKVLVMLFSEYPSYKQIWPQFRAIPDSSLMNAIELRTFGKLRRVICRSSVNVLRKFREMRTQQQKITLKRHASVYMCGLGSIIHSMKNEDDLALQMNRIAKAHIKWNVHRNHVMHMLDPVLDIVKDSNGGKIDAETKQAWTTLYNLIADLIEIYRKKK